MGILLFDIATIAVMSFMGIWNAKIVQTAENSNSEEFSIKDVSLNILTVGFCMGVALWRLVDAAIMVIQMIVQ